MTCRYHDWRLNDFNDTLDEHLSPESWWLTGKSNSCKGSLVQEPDGHGQSVQVTVRNVLQQTSWCWLSVGVRTGLPNAGGDRVTARTTPLQHVPCAVHWADISNFRTLLAPIQKKPGSNLEWGMGIFIQPHQGSIMMYKQAAVNIRWIC
jgi:hypothetical protein